MYCFMDQMCIRDRYYINGFCDSDMIQKIEEFFCKLKADEIPDTPERFVRDKIPYVQIDLYRCV